MAKSADRHFMSAGIGFDEDLLGPGGTTGVTDLLYTTNRKTVLSNVFVLSSRLSSLRPSSRLDGRCKMFTYIDL